MEPSRLNAPWKAMLNVASDSMSVATDLLRNLDEKSLSTGELILNEELQEKVSRHIEKDACCMPKATRTGRPTARGDVMLRLR